MTKIKVFILVFAWPFLMVACASDDVSSAGGPLTLGVPNSGNVIEGDVVPYTILVENGVTYDVVLQTIDGDADLAVCTESDCNSTSGLAFYSVNTNLETDYVNITVSYTGTLYIFVEGVFSSSYIVGVD